jgi:peptidoglycan hydrolase-like protein with peptidoglycan-binding domain
MLGRLLSRRRDAAKLRAKEDIVSLAHAFALALSEKDGVIPNINYSDRSPDPPATISQSTPAQRPEETRLEEAAPQAGAYREQPKTSSGVSRQRVAQGAISLARRPSGRLFSTAIIALALLSGGALLMVKGVAFEIVQDAYARAVNGFRQLAALEHAEGNETERKTTDKQEFDKAIERHAIEAKPADQSATRRQVDEVASPKPTPEAARPSANEETQAAKPGPTPEAVRSSAEEEARAAKPENVQRQAAADSRLMAEQAERGSAAQKSKSLGRVEDAQKAEAGLNLGEQDRKKVQVSLSALGHQTPATGYFGPITRSMITAWQNKQGVPETGFLDNSQLLALHEQAAQARRVDQAKPAATPERAEAGLNLSEQDRKKVQMALNSLGHPISTDSFFGPRTRAMIKAWQKAQGLPDTGFLTEPQLATLFQQAATAEGRVKPKRD